MKRVKIRTAAVAAIAALVLVAMAWGDVAAQQNTTMPNTLRYGTGYFDVPTAMVAPHMTITGTYSGFSLSVDQRGTVNDRGQLIGPGSSFEKWMSTGAVGIALFDRIEVGTTLQSFNDSDAGGTMAGAYGRVAIAQPRGQGFGLAVGARYLSEPSFDGRTPLGSFQPTRLGYPDARFQQSYPGVRESETTLTPFVVASGHVAGFDLDYLPDHDFSAAVGWGDGMFRDGKDLTFYSGPNSNGWFFGGGAHVEVAEGMLLHLIGDWNGFDLNLGAQADIRGVKLGAHMLGVNYSGASTDFRSRKIGFSASVALCPAEGGLCRPGLLERDPRADTVQLPAPPPDTVMVEREVEPPLPTGEAANLCLATGENVQVIVTAQADTLVGPRRVDIQTLRPGVVFAGTYAEGTDWYTQDRAVTYEELEYLRSGGEVRLDCGNIMRVGTFQGVPLFAERAAERPYEMIYVPVRPGVWQAYETDLARVRG